MSTRKAKTTKPRATKAKTVKAAKGTKRVAKARVAKELTFTPATEDSPAMSFVGETDRQRRHLTTAEFGQQVAMLNRDFSQIVRMAKKLGKAGKALELKGQGTFGPKELNALANRHKKMVSSLKKNYSAGIRRKAGVARGVRQSGFSKGVFLQQPLVDFLMNADLGTLPDGTSVRDLVSGALENNLLSRGIITQLLARYKANNDVNFTVEEQAVNKKGEAVTKQSKRIRAGPVMERHLGPYLAELERTDRESGPRVSKKTGKTAEPFDRNNFVFSQMQRIVNPGILGKDELTEEQAAYIADPDTIAVLADIEARLKAAKVAADEE